MRGTYGTDDDFCTKTNTRHIIKEKRVGKFDFNTTKTQPPAKQILCSSRSGGQIE